MPPVACRVATIELTAEQAEALTPRSIGSTWNRETGTQDPILETREVIALED